MRKTTCGPAFGQRKKPYLHASARKPWLTVYRARSGSTVLFGVCAEMACRYGCIRTLTGLSNITLSPAAKLAQTKAVASSIFWVGDRKCSGSNHQIAKPRRPDRVKVSSFDVRAALGPGKSIGKRLNGIKVGRRGPDFFGFLTDFGKSQF